MAQPRLRIAFVGDVCLGMATRDHIAGHGVDYPFDPTHDLLADAHLRVGNLECILVDPARTPDWQKFALSLPSDRAGGLTGAGFEVVSLANNHMMDAGPAGLDETRRWLDAAGIRHFGAGPDRRAAEATLFHEVEGRTLAFLGVCDADYYFAGRDSPGIAPLDVRALGARIRAARNDADLVIVALHADLEFTYHPSRPRVRYSRWLAEQGAHLLWEHHPHVFQGIEHHAGALISYSSGNFVFEAGEYMKNEEGVRDTFVLHVDVDFTGKTPALTWQAHPAVIGGDARPVPVAEHDRAAHLERLARISADLARPTVLRRVWRQRAWRQLRFECKDVYYALRRGRFGLAARTIGSILRHRRHRRWLVGALTAGLR
ncbi:MAG: CapA family protein [Planctomycetota bacterium]|nr:CapA family protein [Planctomycetota bacterium]